MAKLSLSVSLILALHRDVASTVDDLLSRADHFTATGMEAHRAWALDKFPAQLDAAKAHVEHLHRKAHDEYADMISEAIDMPAAANATERVAAELHAQRIMKRAPLSFTVLRDHLAPDSTTPQPVRAVLVDEAIATGAVEADTVADLVEGASPMTRGAKQRGHLVDVTISNVFVPVLKHVDDLIAGATENTTLAVDYRDVFQSIWDGYATTVEGVPDLNLNSGAKPTGYNRHQTPMWEHDEARATLAAHAAANGGE